MSSKYPPDSEHQSRLSSRLLAPSILHENPHASCQTKMPRGTPNSNVQLSNESSKMTSENTQYARLMIVAAAAPKLGKRRVSVGAASMTCIDDNVNEILANRKNSSTAAASTYSIIDQ